MSSEIKEKDSGSAVTCWMPKSLLAWVDAQRKDKETRSGTIKRILKTVWDFSENFSRVSAGEYLPEMPRNAVPVHLEDEVEEMIAEQNALSQD